MFANRFVRSVSRYGSRGNTIFFLQAILDIQSDSKPIAMKECSAYLEHQAFPIPIQLSGIMIYYIRMPIAARSMSAPTVPRPKGAVFKEKTLFEAWCTDVGVSKVYHHLTCFGQHYLLPSFPLSLNHQAYPVMSVIVIAVVFAGGCGLYIAFSHPDARWTKHSRGQIFRGELRDEK